ncbi:hypothetical protein GPW28_04760, partial [Streptococcus thermophilus]|nr:hypothetical protein [Streptococcus thermophilus]MCE2215093.1 hypothetical protein [Streptococcus thermophilus]
KNAWTTSRRVNFLWVANFNLKFGFKKDREKIQKSCIFLLTSDSGNGILYKV